jgi:hypothetical protein
MRDFRLWLALAGVFGGGWLIVRAMDGDRSRPVSRDELPTMVFVCRESHELFVGPARATPAPHPSTEKPTLMPGWYCPKCQTWHAGPPSDVAARAPEKVVCRKTRTPLLREGPKPKDAREI